MRASVLCVCEAWLTPFSADAPSPYVCVRGETALVGPGAHPECRAVFAAEQRARLGKTRKDVADIRGEAGTLVNENGSWVRYNGEGKRLIKVPGNYTDLKLFAVDPEMSADWQIILLVLASILSAFGWEEYGIDRRLSGGFFTAIKAFGIAWASLYWCAACSDFVLQL